MPFLLSALRRFATTRMLAALAAAGLLAGCGGFLTPETPPPVKVTGLVVDQATEAPVQGAEVSVEGGATVLTGPDGTYMVGGLRPGIVYRIVVQKDGYETVAKRFETPGRDQHKPRVTVDFALPSSQKESGGAQLHFRSAQRRLFCRISLVPTSRPLPVTRSLAGDPQKPQNQKPALL